jgi:hypothetical protein
VTQGLADLRRFLLADDADSLCAECGNMTVIRKDGCDFCTACGAVGSCG